MRRLAVRRLAVAVAFLMFALACGTEAADERRDVRLPERSGFAPVSEMLGVRCGSLDCHGHPARNLRLYNRWGLRLDPERVPGGDPTTDAEHSANFASVVALEPEQLESVVLSGGAEPGRLTLVRKGRGSEHHEGGVVIATGGDADRCLVSWLEGLVEAEACARAAELSRP